MAEHTLFAAFRRLKGNARGCVLTEPLWGIPYNLYAPYISVYMIALGLVDQQIGLIASIAQALQVVMALFSGVITDKLGRRKTTLIFDLMSWCVPSLISAIAQNFWYFLIAALVNSLWRVVHNSWSCLLVEDTDPDELVDLYSWIYIAGLTVAFFSPLASLLIKRYDLIPTMRGLYFFAAFMFAVKATVTYLLTQETEQGKVRMLETRHQSIFTVFAENKGVLRGLLRSPRTLITAGIMLILGATGLINGNFWAILVTEKLQVPAQNLAGFQVAKSVFMMFFFFFVLPRLRHLSFKLPMALSFIGMIVSQLLLVLAPVEGYALLVISLLLEAGCAATVGPLLDQMVVVTVEAKERARIQSLIFMGIILLTSPFGWIAGTLSSINRNFPFILNMVLYSLGVLLVGLASRAADRHKQELAEAAAAH
ncbi:MAG: MFS transporter [Anaerolineae bacterium]|nr:MFS transporter [Anaerolineae bacterium]